MNSISAIDCKGLPCPQPVLKCKKCIENNSPESFRIIVDNEAARENVKRFAATKGYTATQETVSGNEIELTLTNTAGAPAASGKAECPVCEVMSQEEISHLSQKICIFIKSDKIGHGDDELGAKLMINFISTLPELGDELWRIIMVNAGVKLAVKGSPVAEKLKDIEQSGVSILVCGTCLDHFELLDKKVLGETTNMLDVVTSLQLATKIITP